MQFLNVRTKQKLQLTGVPNNPGVFIYRGQAWTVENLRRIGIYESPGLSLGTQQTATQFGNPDGYQGYFSERSVNRGERRCA